MLAPIDREEDELLLPERTIFRGCTKLGFVVETFWSNFTCTRGDMDKVSSDGMTLSGFPVRMDFDGFCNLDVTRVLEGLEVEGLEMDGLVCCCTSLDFV